jgi:polar amino acid transport system substrate-binding protein
VKPKIFLSLVVVVIVAAVLIFIKGRFESLGSAVGEPSPTSSTEGTSAAKPTPDDKRLVVGFSFNKPPYTIVGQGEVVDPYAPGARDYGIEPDLFKAAIAPTGKTFTLHSETLSRIALDVYNGTIDAAEISMNEPRRPGVYYSKEFLAYQNVVVTRKAANLKIEKLSDLRGHSVSAWQGASIQHRADYFENLVRDNPNYFESTDQAAQYRMYAEHHVDALVIDKYIFLWWYKQDPRREEFVFHPVLPPNPFCIGFRDPVLRDAFNEGLDRITASGERDKIMQRHFAYVLPFPPAVPSNP